MHRARASDGAFLLLASDVRIGSDGPFKIGLNEVAIGLTVPSFALELARQRLTPAHFSLGAVTGVLFTPREALQAGFFDRVVAPGELAASARATAVALAKIDLAAHAATKHRARGAAIKAVQAAIDAEINLEAYQARVAAGT